jgi:hypothetical protein
MLDLRPISIGDRPAEFEESLAPGRVVGDVKADFVTEVKSGGVIAGVFEILDNCGEKFIANVGIVRADRALEVCTVLTHSTNFFTRIGSSPS